MPRKRQPERLDQIAEAATEVFIQDGFGPARIARIAAVARVGPGTIYLYAESKDALYELALRRALEDPDLWELKLPHPTPVRGQLADHVWRCLQNAAHFPQLWLAADSPAPPRETIGAELDGILSELFAWLYRYRHAIKLIEKSAVDWPDVAQVFYRRFWRGGIRRISDYLGKRMREGVIPRRDSELAAAQLLVEAMTWMAVHRHWSDADAPVSDQAVTRTVLPMLRAAILRTAE